jgi:solute carrier family 25 (mitochondrial phosphate transporter), member 3
MDGLHIHIPYDDTYSTRDALEAIHRPTTVPIIDSPATNSYRYFACFLAGGLSSSVRWALIPLEVVKTKMQVNGAAASSSSIVGSILSIYRTDGVRGLSRGLSPMAMAYGIQTSTKYGCYEIFKDRLTPTDCGNPNHVWIYKAIAAGLAEATADVLMCPWEMVKVRVQTAALQGDRSFPERLVPAFLEMARHPKLYNFPFGALPPLWMRQIPGTMANFCLFESTATFLCHNIWNRPSAEECTVPQRFVVTVGAGIVAGIASSVISHPADSIISLLSTSTTTASTTHRPRTTVSTIIRNVGWYRLATRGLAPRTLITTTIIVGQWLLYGTFKSLLLDLYPHSSSSNGH